MQLSQQAEELGQSFAQLVIDEQWEALSQLFESKRRLSAETLQQALEWKSLLPNLERAYTEETGLDVADSGLQAPARSEVWNDVCRDNEYGPEPVLSLGKCAEVQEDGTGPFIEIVFMPADDSEFDNCYRCYLTVIDGDEPKVSGFELTLNLDG